jgi:predicted nucleotidyltransferase
MDEYMSNKWVITPEKVQVVIGKIIELSQPRKIILFGSYIRGNTHLNSDLDILIVTKNEVESPRKESIRIRHALKGIHISMDILVISESKLKELANVPWLIYREAIKYGSVVYETT